MHCEFKLPARFEHLLHDAIVRHLKPDQSSVGYVPNCAELSEALQVALWSSVLRDEGRMVRFTINLRPGTIPSRVIPLRKPIEFSATQLARLSMATTPTVSAVHAGPGAERLEIFGIDTLIGNPSAVTIEVLGPAVVAVRAGNATVAFISGSEAELIDLDVYAKYFFVDTAVAAESAEDYDREHRFIDIARAMHRHGHGGTLLVLDAAAAAQPARLGGSLEAHYLLAQAFDGLREVDAQENSIFVALQVATGGYESRELFTRLRAAELLRSQYIAGLARTTATDGAAVVSHDGALLAFGCRVMLQNTPRIWRRRPTALPASEVALADFGGTRHQAAARFVGHHPGSRAIVASQDGKVSILNHARLDQVDCLEHAEWIF